MFGREHETMLEMLSYMRPHDSKTERKFIRRYILPLGVEPDNFNNYHKTIGDAPILWSCHTDTVHRKHGRQTLAISNSGVIKLSRDSKSNCLGADDTAGVWLMREMILAKVPGVYVFHRGEEHGCIGSRYIAKETPSVANGIQCAIALDRKGTDSVITHQMGDRSCSEDFAKSLATALGGKFKPDDTGLYTDTASYTEIIGECTNLSVGYEGAHGDKETLDSDFLRRLRDKICAIDFSSALVFKRKPGELDPAEDDPFSRYGWMPSKSGAYSRGATTRSTVNGNSHRELVDALEHEPIAARSSTDIDQLERLCQEYPQVAAMILEQYGCDPEGFEDVITELYGDIL